MAERVTLSGGELRTEGGATVDVGALYDFPTALAESATKPEVPATPDAQDVVDALVTLGLVTQAEA